MASGKFHCFYHPCLIGSPKGGESMGIADAVARGAGGGRDQLDLLKLWVEHTQRLQSGGGDISLPAQTSSTQELDKELTKVLQMQAAAAAHKLALQQQQQEQLHTDSLANKYHLDAAKPGLNFGRQILQQQHLIRPHLPTPPKSSPAAAGPPGLLTMVQAAAAAAGGKSVAQQSLTSPPGFCYPPPPTIPFVIPPTYR